MIHFSFQPVHVRTFPSVLALAQLVILTGCGGDVDRESPSALPTDSITVFDRIVDSETGLLGRATSIAVDPEGGVWLTDRMNHRLLVVRPEGVVETIGREGAGPVEFRAPIGIGIGARGVEVYDSGNGRLQRLSLAGELERTDPVPDGFPFPASMSGNGMVAGGTMGRDQSLVAVVGPAVPGGRRLRGAPRARDVLEISLGRMRTQAEEGEVPLEFRNSVIPVLGPEGDVWLVVQGEAAIEHFDADGRLRWETSLEGAEVDAAFERFFSAWDGPVSLNSVPFPWVVHWGVVSGEELWLMLEASGEAGSVIVVVDARTGTTQRRIHLDLGERAGPFAVDEERGRVYLVSSDGASVVGAALPGY